MRVYACERRWGREASRDGRHLSGLYSTDCQPLDDSGFLQPPPSSCIVRFFAVTLHSNLAHRPSATRGCRWHLQARHKSIVGNSCCSDCQNTGDHHLVAYSGCNSLARQQRIRHPCVGWSSAHISMGLFDYGRIIVELFLWIFNFHQIICFPIQITAILFVMNKDLKIQKILSRQTTKMTLYWTTNFTNFANLLRAVSVIIIMEITAKIMIITLIRFPTNALTGLIISNLSIQIISNYWDRLF